MGFSTRPLVVTESGRVEKISTAKLNRVGFRGERWREYAGQELKILEVAVEVDRTKILRVFRVLPYRARFDAEGRPDPPEELWRARVRMNRALESYLERLPSMDERIAHLQADASYFWEPTESEWTQAAELLGVRVTDMRNARFRLPDE